MARATRSTTATHQPHQSQRKRKRASSPSATAAAKVQKTDDDGDEPTDPLPFLSEHDAQKILNVLELSDTQGLLDRVFPSTHAPDLLLSLRTLLERPAEHPLTAVKAAINNLFPISSLPRSRPSPAASQQLAFTNLALSLIEQASCNSISASLDTTDILESSKADNTRTSPLLAKRKYALVQHLPSGDYWSSLSSDTPSSELKNLPTGHAELVAIIPTAPSASTDAIPTLGSVSSRPLAHTKHIQGQRRVTTGAFLDYGPYASFAPCFENAGEIVGQRQLSEVIYQKEQKKREAEQRRRDQPSTSAQAISEEEKDVAMNAESAPHVTDEDLNSLLPPEEVKAFKETLGSLELEAAVTQLLEQNSRALKRLEELQMRRFSESSPKVKPVEEGSEEWETAEDGPSLVPSPAVLRKLHRSLALEPSAGWYGNLPTARPTTLHDDSTIKVKSPTPAPAATAAATAVPNATAPVAQTPASAYAGYPYNYGTTQQSAYRPAATGYASYKPGQGATYYQAFTPSTTQQSYYNPQSYAGSSNQQPYGSSGSGQTYPYGSWNYQYNPAAASGSTKPSTPTTGTASYNAFFNATAAANGATAGRPPAVANTVANKPAAPAAGAWPAIAAGVAPTLPTHLRTAQTSTPVGNTTYQQQTGYYQAYPIQPAATPSR
ncbi:hypothetical protein MD484_g7371, partial [Candolleomyces efflorescens]